MDKRLTNWKAKTLSFVGRLTLTKSVVQALPTYVMQSALIPRYLCDEIDKRCRCFLWGDNEYGRHLHSVTWTDICLPKEWGGLSLRSARNINKVSLMKATWDLTTKKNDMWVNVVRTKYRCGREGIPNMDLDKSGSNLWRGLCGVWKGTQQNLIWRYGKGRAINC